MNYLLLYGDHPDTIVHEYSRHRSQAVAEWAKEQALKDPYWRTHYFVIQPIGKGASDGQTNQTRA